MGRETMKIEGFKRKFAEIRNKQFKPLTRGTASATNTLKILLGLGIDNIESGDLGFAELRVRMRGSTNTVKLFSLGKDSLQLDKDDVFLKSITESDQTNNRLLLERRNGHITKTGLMFFSNDEYVTILSPVGDIVAKWSLDVLISLFTKKIKNLVIVSAESTLGRGGYDYLVYRTALYLHGFSKTSIRTAFLNNVITLNPHIGTINIKPDKTWDIKNHGTVFQINEEKLEDIFEHRDFL